MIEVRDRRPRHWFWLDDDIADYMGICLGSNCLLVYVILCRHADKDQKTWPSQEVIAKKCGISERSVRNAIRCLEINRVIHTEKKKESGRFSTNIYYLSDIQLWRLPEAPGAAGVESNPQSYPQQAPEAPGAAGTGGKIEHPPEAKSNIHRRHLVPANQITTELDKNRTIPPAGGFDKPKQGLKRQTDYQQVVDLITKSYKTKFKAKYPFTGKSGSAVKRLIGLYGVEDVCALWEEFLARDWDWLDRDNKRVRVARSLETFQSKLTLLLEDGAYKRRVQAPKPETREGMAGMEETVGAVLRTVGEPLA